MAKITKEQIHDALTNIFSKANAEEIMKEMAGEARVIEVVKEVIKEVPVAIENVAESKKSKYTREVLFGMSTREQNKLLKELGAEAPKKEWQRVELILELTAE